MSKGPPSSRAAKNAAPARVVEPVPPPSKRQRFFDLDLSGDELGPLPEGCDERVHPAMLAKLAAIQATIDEMAGAFGIPLPEFEVLLRTEPYREIWEMSRHSGKINLRRLQLEMAHSNVAMAIFMGKQILDQRDNSQVAITGAGGGPLDVRVQLIERLTKAAEANAARRGEGE